ncbi:hypothetical protein DFA_02172 [Cavenderia fasciculata]|uniref:Metallo-beta-lactamase domain-containing protein n=1 Tax=Cavenderia fasciculata TaxID=261658 RepID=F4PYB8_CACFS|nr:uncharacterized protein DFA_02172 [Cavenderia fasciculata]EGG19385.1 hypothetical protein DFA_02172 [Cavenderia fasciculata]|eukprot:XP_004357656.1 hypothetical protein DFA_02172 [Cavenderia fasciculata]
MILRNPIALRLVSSSTTSTFLSTYQRSSAYDRTTNLFSTTLTSTTLPDRLYSTAYPNTLTFKPPTTDHNNNNNHHTNCNHKHQQQQQQTMTSKINYWSNLIIYNEDTNQCLYVKNKDESGTTSSSLMGIVSKFYSFPSIQSTIPPPPSNQQQQQQVTLNQHQMINQLPFERLNKQLFNNQISKQQVFYLGSLLSPYYVSQLARDHVDYYLFILSNKDNNVQDLLTVDDRVSRFMLDGKENQQPLSSPSSSFSLEWDTPTNIVKRFRQYRGEGEGDNQQGVLITPETMYMSKVLGLFEKDRFNLLATPEDQDSLGTKISLEYAPGIESIPMLSSTLMPYNSTNLIMSLDQGHVLLVDPGANSHGQTHLERIIKTRLSNYLDLHGANLSIFITHEHTDHWESLPLIASHFSKAKVIAHQETLDELDMNGVAPELTRVAVRGKPLDKAHEPDTTNEIHIGSKVFDIVATPGHTSNSLCLFERQSKTLIAGDHIVGWGSSILDFRTGDMKQYLNSTQGMIDHLQPSIAMPAHGPTSYTPIQLLQSYIKHRLLREQSILQAYQSGKTSLRDILSVVYKDIDPKLNDMAMGNIQLHLKKLRQDNVIDNQ